MTSYESQYKTEKVLEHACMHMVMNMVRIKDF